MRILIVCPYFHPAISFGGVTSTTYNMSIELSKNGHDVVVYTSDAESKTSRLQCPKFSTYDGVSVHYFRNISSSPMGGFFITPNLLPMLLKNLKTFDIIHLHEFRTFQNIITSKIADSFQKPYVLQPHGTIPRIDRFETRKLVFDALVGKKILRNASAIIPMSDFEKHQIIDLNVLNSKFKIIPNNVNLQLFTKALNVEPFRKKYSISTESKVILYLGRLHKIKNIAVLIHAFSKISAKHKNCTLVIAGPDYGELDNLQRLSQNLKLGNRVIFTGLLGFKEKLIALHSCRFVVLPSRYELFGTVILEAFASKKPVIGSKVGSTPELVIPNITGYLFEPDDIIQLSKYLDDLLSDDSKVELMGKNGQKLVREKYTVDLATARLVNVYQEIIEKF